MTLDKDLVSEALGQRTEHYGPDPPSWVCVTLCISQFQLLCLSFLVAPPGVTGSAEAITSQPCRSPQAAVTPLLASRAVIGALGCASASGAFVQGPRHLTITGCGYLLRHCDVDLGLGLSLSVCGLGTVTP